MPETLRFGLIGVGRWGKVYIRTLLSLSSCCRLTHLCTSKPANAALLPYSVKVMGDWRELVGSDCDAVIIATPPDTHAEILESCLDAGKPCIVEKPFCLDLATAERLHQRIQASNLPVLVNHTHLFNPAYQALKGAVEKAGETVRLILSEGMALGPFRADTPALWDRCPHDFSLCLDLLGETPLRIAGLGGPLDPRGSPELVSFRLDFPGGASAWVQAGNLSPQKRRNLSVFTDTRLYLLDDMASVKLTVSSIDFPRRYAGGIPEVLEKCPIMPTSGLLPMANAVTYFLEGLAGGDRQNFGTELAIEVTRLLTKCDGVIRSYDSRGFQGLAVSR